MKVNSIAKNPILDVPGVTSYIKAIIHCGYSADVLPWWQEIFNLRIVSIIPYTKESTWRW